MPTGTYVEDRKGRLVWLEAERRDMASTAQLLVLSQNWSALLEKVGQLIEVDAEIRGLQAKTRPAE